MTAGFLAFLYMRMDAKGIHRVALFMKTLFNFSLGVISGLVCLYGVGWLALGYAPDLVALAKLFDAEQVLVASGYLAGGRLKFQPIPVLMVLHCLYTIVRISLSSDFPAGFRNSIRMAISTMCLLWFTYFINRPAPGDQYLIACYFLYSFLLIDLVRSASRQ
jgi:hypothetical protein